MKGEIPSGFQSFLPMRLLHLLLRAGLQGAPLLRQLLLVFIDTAMAQAHFFQLNTQFYSV